MGTETLRERQLFKVSGRKVGLCSLSSLLKVMSKSTPYLWQRVRLRDPDKLGSEAGQTQTRVPEERLSILRSTVVEVEFARVSWVSAAELVFIE